MCMLNNLREDVFFRVQCYKNISQSAGGPLFAPPFLQEVHSKVHDLLAPSSFSKEKYWDTVDDETLEFIRFYTVVYLYPVCFH